MWLPGAAEELLATVGFVLTEPALVTPLHFVAAADFAVVHLVTVFGMFLLETVVVVAAFVGFVCAVFVVVAVPESSVSEMSSYLHAAAVVFVVPVGSPYEALSLSCLLIPVPFY